jgi:hypothetical protein
MPRQPPSWDNQDEDGDDDRDDERCRFDLSTSTAAVRACRMSSVSHALVDARYGAIHEILDGVVHATERDRRAVR